jgi:hypothetical protein
MEGALKGIEDRMLEKGLKPPERPRRMLRIFPGGRFETWVDHRGDLPATRKYVEGGAWRLADGGVVLSYAGELAHDVVYRPSGCGLVSTAGRAWLSVTR